MKPISICFQCFGPYMTKQYIDFRELENNGLFLICGETGSGKTTILDAMCYALYGKSSGGTRGDLLDMRCKRAGKDDETFVEFIFSSGENTYRFYRSRKPKRQQKARAEAGAPLTFNEEYECQIKKDGRFVPMADTKATQTYMDHQAERIIGLKYEQFQQVVILPQGKFEKLLTSGSDEKEKILVTLFHAGKWQKVAEKIYDRAMEQSRKLDTEKTLIEESLSRYDCENIAQLREKCSGTEQVLSQMRRSTEQAREEENRCRAVLEQEKSADKEFQLLEESLKKLEKLQGQELSRKQDQAALDLADRAERIVPDYQAYQSKKNAAEDALQKQKTAKDNLQQAEKYILSLEKEKQNHENERKLYESLKEKRTILQNLESVYQAIETNQKVLSSAETELQKAEKALKTAEKNNAEKVENLEKAVEVQNRAIADFQRGQALYMKGIGSVLAAKLTEGEKCPVCGSTSHPEPARPGEESVSEDRLNSLDRAVEEASAGEKQARAEQQEASKALENAKIYRAECNQKRDAAESVCQAALNQRCPGVDNEAQRVAAIRELNKKIQAFEETENTVQEQYTTALGEQKSAAALALQADAAAEAAENEKKQAEKQWQTILAGESFEDTQSFLSAKMDPQEKQELQKQVIQFVTDLKNAQTDALEKQKAAEGKQRPDIMQANGQLTAAVKTHKDCNDRCVLLDKEWNEQKELLQKLEKQLPQYQEKRNQNDENIDFAVKLRGNNGIGLQRYVLGVMLTSITNQANKLLKTVYGGRYQLYRTNDAAGRKHKRGLDLEVADQDGRRSVNSLSGGEKFLLSLSLGIGLSSVVQAQGRGIRLEAMFIDEGFGSLDSKSINDAMEILETVRRSSGIVGIISHVDALAETIPAKIEITKTGNGSQCRVSC